MPGKLTHDVGSMHNCFPEVCSGFLTYQKITRKLKSRIPSCCVAITEGWKLPATCALPQCCSVPVQSPVWSVAWSTQYEHQLLLGLDRGRLAVADIRKPSGEMLVSCSSSGSSSSGGARVFQPLHRLIPLQDWQLDLALRAQQDGSSSSSRNWTADKPEVIVACTGKQVLWT